MSLPACQQRALDRMEGALRASEPRLASMYMIFGRLNAGEPIGTERLTRRRQRWLQPGTTMYAIVLVPVMFAAITGIVVPEPSAVDSSTVRREPTAEWPGTMNTSSYVRSYGGFRSLRKRTC